MDKDFKLNGEANLQIGGLAIRLSSSPENKNLTLDELLNLRDDLYKKIDELNKRIKDIQGG